MLWSSRSTGTPPPTWPSIGKSRRVGEQAECGPRSRGRDDARGRAPPTVLAGSRVTGATRVALVIGQLHAGGSERQVSELAPRLRGGRCEPVVYCLSEVVEPFGPRLQAAGILLRVIPRRRSFEPRRAF